MKRLTMAAAIAVSFLITGCGTTTAPHATAMCVDRICATQGGGGGNIGPTPTDPAEIGTGGSGGVVVADIACGLCTVHTGSGGNVPAGAPGTGNAGGDGGRLVKAGE